MKTLLMAAILILFVTNVMAAHVECYSGARVLYVGDAKDVYYVDKKILFREKDTGDIFFASGNCIVKFAPDEIELKERKK